MKKLVTALLVIFTLSRCGNSHAPDVSDIKIDLRLQRFEKDFFAIDSGNLQQGMENLQKKYPYFLNDFIQNIAIGGPIGRPTNSSLTTTMALMEYMRNTRPIYEAIKDKNSQLTGLEKELQQGFRYVKYYYPDYKIPAVITYVGLIGDPSVALTKDALAIGLQMYAGKDFSAYNTLDAQQAFPQYISRRFEPAFITANCFQNVVMDIYPDNSAGKPLIEQMVEKGKQWYLLDKILPHTPDSLKTGYTGKQVAWCKKNEGIIWAMLSKNTDLYTTDPLTLQMYVGEAPKTEGMPDASPGNIGQWIGLQIVKSYAAQNNTITLQQLLATDARKLFMEAKYRPK
jgi:hypothetical protein